MNEPLSPPGESVAPNDGTQKAAGLRRLRRIVVGVDRDPASRDAQALAETLSERTGAELLLSSAGGSDSDLLKEVAAAENADLIITPDREFDDAPCAIAVAPPGLASARPDLDAITVAYDGGREAAVALDLATELAEHLGSALLIVGVVDLDDDNPASSPAAVEEVETGRMRRHLERARQRVPPTVAVETRLLRGAAHRAIVEAAAASSLLLLGSRVHYGPVRHLSLGSVARQIVRDAPCATLITAASHPPSSS